MLLAGCGTAEIQSAPTLLRVTPSAAPTLPPTWTPSPSFTPSRTPTVTLSPTATLTVTPTQTLTADAICDRFALTGSPVEGVSVAYKGGIGFSWEDAPYDSAVIVSLVHVASGEEKLFQFAPEMGFSAIVEMEDLPAWGVYQWRVSLFIEPYGELCPHEGQIYREPWWLKPIENPLAPPFEED